MFTLNKMKNISWKTINYPYDKYKRKMGKIKLIGITN